MKWAFKKGHQDYFFTKYLVCPSRSNFRKIQYQKNIMIPIGLILCSAIYADLRRKNSNRRSSSYFVPYAKLQIIFSFTKEKFLNFILLFLIIAFIKHFNCTNFALHTLDQFILAFLLNSCRNLLNIVARC